MQRNLTITMAALLAVTLLMLVLSSSGRKMPDKVPTTSAKNALDSLNRRNSSVKSVLCPNIRTGIASNSSLFYRKDDLVSLSSWFLGLKEAVVSCDRSEYWFWIRSFDAKSVYFCDPERLEKTDLRPIMRPEVIEMIAWVGEIETSYEILRSKNGFVARTRKGSIDILVEFNQDRILSQTALSEGLIIATLEGLDFAEFSGLILPRRIKAVWYEEKLAGEFIIDKWIINAEDPLFLPPKGLKRVNLEDYSSSSRKSVFASSFPTPDVR